MIIRKFGGTSISSADMMRNVRNIVNDEEEQIIVLSAIAGITNRLENIVEYINSKSIDLAKNELNSIHEKYIDFVDGLIVNTDIREECYEYLRLRKSVIISIIDNPIKNYNNSIITADGELISTFIFHKYRLSLGEDTILISALDFMRIDKSNEPDEFYIRENLSRILKENKSKTIITQGYICRDAFGEVSNLERGGSDYTATIIAKAIRASRIEIWTDIDGIHNNDPRYVENTEAIDSLSFDEAAELAYFGAKILHPTALQPAASSYINVFLKNTMNPRARGTVISSAHISDGIKAIAAKDNITVIRIKSARMLNAYGFLSKVFEVFELYKTAIDMITTSEVAISVTIDNNTYLKNIIKDLSHFSDVEYDIHQSIIAVVGIMKIDKEGYAAMVFNALNQIPVRMISYGASNYNVSILLDTKYKKKALNTLQNSIMNN